MNKKEEVLVLFSGGRDSSSTVVEMIKKGYDVVLYTYQAGMPELVGPTGDSAPAIRHRELIEAFPGQISDNRVLDGNTYLIRKLAIEKTNKTHVVYPIALALAVNAGAFVYCLKNGIKHIACGYSGYQATDDKYIEQRDDFYNLMKDFAGEYGITYHAPIIEMSKKEVMDILEINGISSNSLENKSLYGGINFDVDKAHGFWNESISECRNYISKLLNDK